MANNNKQKDDPRFWLTPEEVKELRDEVAEALKYIERLNKRLNSITPSL